MGGVKPDTELEQLLQEATLSSFASAENLLNVPIFVQHGDVDQEVNVENSRFAVSLLQRWG
jgi:hypothetical protein